MALKIAVTGGIGAGKSTLSARLGALGAVVVDSDRVAREVVAPGTIGLARVAAEFGSGVLSADGSLDRAALAAIVFGDVAARRRLEEITHPLVRQQFDSRLAEAPADAIVVNDIPLLVDQRVAAGFHLVIGVHAAPELRIERLVARGLAAADARARIDAQIDDHRRAELCDVWLANHGDHGELTTAVDQLWARRVLAMRDALLDRRAVPAEQWAGLRPGLAERTELRVRNALQTPVDLRADDSGIEVELPETPPPAVADRLAAAGFPPEPGSEDNWGSADPALRILIRPFLTVN